MIHFGFYESSKETQTIEIIQEISKEDLNMKGKRSKAKLDSNSITQALLGSQWVTTVLERYLAARKVAEL